MIKVRYDKITGKIGKSYPETMDVPQPYAEMSEVDHDKIRAIVLKDGEDLFFRDSKFIVEQDIQLAKQLKSNLATSMFEQALKQPLQVADVYVLGEWANTYTNTYVALLTDLEDGVLDTEVNILVLLPNGLLKEELIETIEEFKPYYNAVKNNYKVKATKRNSYLVQIQNAQTIEELEAIIIEY